MRSQTLRSQESDMPCLGRREGEREMTKERNAYLLPPSTQTYK